MATNSTTFKKPSFHTVSNDISAPFPKSLNPAWQMKTLGSSNPPIPLEYPSMALISPIQGPVSSLFRGAFQNGFLSIFYAVGSKPMELWEKQLRSGTLKRVIDYEIRSQTLELLSTTIPSTFITCPPGPYQSLGIRLPIIVLVVKNLKRYFTFEIQVLDDTKTRRRFRVSNFNNGAKVRPHMCSLPLKMDDGWNQISINLADITRRVYGASYVETVRVQVHANCRLRRIYFCAKVFGEEDVPTDFKAFVLKATNDDESQEDVQQITSQSRAAVNFKTSASSSRPDR